MSESTWSDRYTAQELAAALELYANQIAKLTGWYDRAGEMRDAAECLRDLSEQIEQLRSAGGDIMRRIMATKESLTDLP